MPQSTPNPRLRGRLELALRVLAPSLDLLLGVGERVSRLLSPEDPNYVTARMRSGGESAPRGLRVHR
jgi:hypothetical protein